MAKKKNDTDNWLEELSKEMIIEDHLGRKVVLDDVIDHLSCTPHKPLPKDLIKILDTWLQATSAHRIEKMHSGRPEAEWYPIALRLIDNGFSHAEACEEIRKQPEYKYLETTSMMDMLKRHLRKRSTAQKKADRMVRKITDSQKDSPSD